MSDSSTCSSIEIAIAWCLAWGTEQKPKYPIETLNRWRRAITKGETPADTEWRQILSQASDLAELRKKNADFSLEVIAAFADQHPDLHSTQIGLVYGGVTKVKSYVFESADLQEIRGASALLDRINLVDLPAFFGAETAAGDRFRQCQEAATYCHKHVREGWLDAEFEDLSKALIPELIVYSTGGNLLALCPAAFTDRLCDAIEKRYTTETLSANSCAVGISCRPLEIYYGLLNEKVDNTPWQKALAEGKTNPAVQAYFGIDENTPANEQNQALRSRKNFGELVGKLTSQFIQRRSGYDQPTARPSRPSRRFPPMFETHPYLMRDDSDIRSTVAKLKDNELPDEPQLSEPTARKRRVGQIVKRESAENQRWYRSNGFESLWNPAPTEERTFQSWVGKFERFLKGETLLENYDKGNHLFDRYGNIYSSCEATREARSLHEIGDSSNGYVGYIYADGNSMGQYIREQIETPTGYREFSEHIFEATEKSVYRAIAQHLHPHYYTPTAKSSRQPKKKDKDPVWIHPFEIITIGGDDVLLIVPANKAIEIARSIGEYFEEELLKHGDRYKVPSHIDITQQNKVHRYRPDSAQLAKCRLSTSSGVLITAANTPIYYADKLVSQLQKSAKKKLKTLKSKGYYGGTVDFLVLKAVTMISSDIEAFRREGLTLSPKDRQHCLKLQAAPYTLHELDGLIKTVKAFKQSSFPKSQLYQIRSLLERGKRTAILNYRYFRVRLPANQRSLIETQFENAWCKAKTNDGNLAPWIAPKSKGSVEEATEYETIWRELVDLEPFIEVEEDMEPATIEINESQVRRSAL